MSAYNKNNNNDILRSNPLQVKNVPNVNVQKNEEKSIPIENEKVNLEGSLTNISIFSIISLIFPIIITIFSHSIY